ncbi:MAG: iron-containing alcohol dehydrogenase family protein [Opitutales bacterium]
MISKESFQCRPMPEILFGAGRLAEAGSLVRRLGMGRVLLVTDPGVEDAGHTERLLRTLIQSGVQVSIFDAVEENPTTRTARNCAEAAKEFSVDGFVGLGGGSAIDAAKAGNFLFTNGGEMAHFKGYGKAVSPLLPLVAIPTTSGTGSDCQSYAVIADESTHEKMACGDPTALPRISLLDPLLTETQPPAVAARVAMDAISHAVESYVCNVSTPHSRLFAREAFRWLASSVMHLAESEPGLEARSKLQLGASYAGIAIENSMLGAAHASANPLTARYDVPHGQAVGVMLPAVIRYNGEKTEAAERYAELAGYLGDSWSELSGTAALAGWIEQLLVFLGLGRSLAELGLPGDVLETLAEEASTQWTGRFNPRPVNADALLEIYRESFTPRDVVA